MKQRITYLLPQGTGLDRTDIEVTSASLIFSKAAQAAQEWHLTLDLKELLDELRVILKDVQALHMRWSSPLDRDRILPLVARNPAGFHAFFTPRDGNIDVPLCSLFEKLIDDQDIKCDSVAASFSRPQLITERVATSSSLQFFANASPGRKLGDFFLIKICQTQHALDACDSQIHELAHADYVDVDYEGGSSVMTITAYWSPPDRNTSPRIKQRAERPIRKIGLDSRLEVGVLQVENTEEADQIKLGGYLTVLGEDGKPGATVFSFPSRHHSLPPSSPLTFQASLTQPTGLHPKLTLAFPLETLRPPDHYNNCALNTYLTLPSQLFLDKYQLSDSAFLNSQNIRAFHSLSGATDLEAPDWVVPQWGSAALFQLAASARSISVDPSSLSTPQPQSWNVTIPMHLRYVNGSTSSPSSGNRNSQGGDTATVKVAWPAVFWACESETFADFSKEKNPFDRVNLGYDTLFSPGTVFYHVPPAPFPAPQGRSGRKDLVEEVSVPVLDVTKAEWVPLGTLVVVGVGFLWVCWKLLGVGNGRTSHSGQTQKKTGKRE